MHLMFLQALKYQSEDKNGRARQTDKRGFYMIV